MTENNDESGDQVRNYLVDRILSLFWFSKAVLNIFVAAKITSETHHTSLRMTPTDGGYFEVLR